MGEDIHTMPDDGKHECSDKCFCGPQIYYVDDNTGIKCWLHNDTRKDALQ